MPQQRVRTSDWPSLVQQIGLSIVILLILSIRFSFAADEGESDEVSRLEINPPPVVTIPPKGNVVIKINHDGLARNYLLHIPPSYVQGQPMPLVINLHGGGGNAKMQQKSSQMNVKADQAGFMVAYPEGTGRAIFGKIFGTFNAGRCCGPAKQQRIDDVGFISKMIDDIASRYTLDSRRIYATGHSNGALMSYRLACELSDRIAAIAPNAAQDAFDNCQPSRPVPVIHFHGTADPAAKFVGGHCGGKTKDPGWTCRSVPGYLAQWRQLNRCSDNYEVVYDRGSAQCRSWSHCENDAEVQLCRIEGAGHTWPGGKHHKKSRRWKRRVGSLSNDISANDAMWEFFQRHPMPIRQ